MVTVCASEEALALLLSAEEQRDIRGAIRVSLEQAGLAPWADLEAELFERGDDSLLLARPRSPLLTRRRFRRRHHAKH